MAFCAGLLAGGVLTSSVLLVVGSVLRAPLPAGARWAAVAAMLAVVLLRERGIVALRLPENRRLVPQSVFRLGRHLGPLQFGLEMGTGARTYLPSGLPYVGAVAVLLVATPVGALGAGIGFGLGRALMTMSNLRYSADNSWDDQWRRHARVLALLTGGAFLLPLCALALAG